MTWSARITKPDGTVDGPGYYACTTCKHGNYDHYAIGATFKAIMPCYIPKMASSVGNLLTSIDTGANGHMASGTAELRCNGYEKREEVADAE